MTRLEIVVNGKVVAEAEGPGRALQLSHTWTADGPAWIAARVDGDYDPLVVNDARLFAHTTPVWAVLGGKRYVDRDDAEFSVGWIERLIDGVEQRGKFPNEQRRRAGADLFRKAQDYYRAACAE